MEHDPKKPIHSGPGDSWHGTVAPGGRFAPEAVRYHLYIGLICPFAHRVNLGDDKGWPGWQFPELEDRYAGSTPDTLFGSRYLHEVYFKADAACPSSGTPRRCGETVGPVPAHLGAKIDEVGGGMARDLNTGVYKAGQAAYEEGVVAVFAALNQLEALVRSRGGPYVLGAPLTELDARGSYPVLHEWLKNLYWNVAGFRETTDFRYIEESYTKSHDEINPLAITPLGPYPDIESGVNLDFANIEPGVVRHPAVVAYQETLPAI
ncbi:glutathione S-transferase [Xylariomycetidae sp. FL0641]|nr:glutathione S-transferase [Xylariomycetidae sp. FL0641]